MDKKQVRLTVDLDAKKHQELKSICALSGNKIKDVVTDLIDVFIGAVGKDHEK